MKAYHFLRGDMRSGKGREKAWTAGEEREIKGRISLCERGYHSSPNWYDALVYAPGGMACIVEVSEPVEQDPDKQVSRKRKLIAARDANKLLREYACACAERALKKAKVTDERCWDAIKVARLFSEGKATVEELAVASSAARATSDAARATAAGAAARATSDAAGAAAWAASDAARAASDAAGATARATARATAAEAAWAASDAEIKWQRKRLNKLMDKLFEVSQ